MTTLKMILIAVAILAGIYLLLCLVGPKRMEVSRALTMNAGPMAVYLQVDEFKTWGKWSPWHQKDPNMKLAYGEKTSGVGASYSWESKKMGNGTMEVLEADPGKRIKGRIQFSNWEGYSYDTWLFEPAGENQTNVTWSLEGDRDMPFFFRGMALVMGMKGAITRDYEEGLSNLKTWVESLPASGENLTVTTYEMGVLKFAAVRKQLPMAEMTAFLGSAFQKTMEKLQSDGQTPAGAPCGFYFSWDMENQTTDMAAGFPLAPLPAGQPSEEVKTPGGLLKVFPGALVIDYYGAYEKIAPAHEAMDQWIKSHKKEQAPDMPVIEEYVTDPANEPDTAKWLTRLYYFYK